MKIYEIHNNQIGVSAKWLYLNPVKGGSGLLTKSAYKMAIHYGNLIQLRRGGRSNLALVKFNTDMYNDLYNRIIEIAGQPNVKKLQQNRLEELIEIDHFAEDYYASFRKDNGTPMTFEMQREYVNTASILNGIRTLIEDYLSHARANGQTKARMWKNIGEWVNSLQRFNPHKIPGTYRRIEEKYNTYWTNNERNYDLILDGNLGNSNKLKIKDDIADWWVGMYALPIKTKIEKLMLQYNDIKAKNNWPDLTTEAVRQYLFKADVKRLWYAKRHGKDAWTNKFGYKFKRDYTGAYPNAYWVIDGSKGDLIHYYDNKMKMAALMRVDYLFDVYSEALIGYSFSQSESHVDHFIALKMAAAKTMARPHLLTYDNQSGHVTSRMQSIYSGIVAKNKGTHYPHKAYRHSSPAEGMIGRFQEEYLNQFWFSDKQSPTTRTLDSKPNLDFIKKFKHKLPQQDELIKAFEVAVNDWNNAKHPHFNMSRLEALNTADERIETLDINEMIETFWIEETKGNRYLGDGIHLKLAGQEYTFEVFNSDGSIDTEFRRKYVQDKFIIRYDPEMLDKGIQLWQRHPQTKQMSFVAIAEPKRAYIPIPALQTTAERSQFLQDWKVVDQEWEDANKEMEIIQKRAGISEEKLIADQEFRIKMGGELPKDERNELEAVESFTDRL